MRSLCMKTNYGWFGEVLLSSLFMAREKKKKKKNETTFFFQQVEELAKPLVAQGHLSVPNGNF